MWVGALLEGVQVDPWGKFKFMLLRVKDRNGRQVLLVRGANNSSESKIVEELHKQVGTVGPTCTRSEGQSAPGCMPAHAGDRHFGQCHACSQRLAHTFLKPWRHVSAL